MSNILYSSIGYNSSYIKQLLAKKKEYRLPLNRIADTFILQLLVYN